MIGLLIAAHGSLGDSLLQCISYVYGRRPDNVSALDLMAYPNTETMLLEARERIAKLDEGEGVLILTDLYGATPSNIICRLLEPGRVEAVAGVNLPMLLKVLHSRQASMAEVVERAERGGHEGVFHVEFCRCDA